MNLRVDRLGLSAERTSDGQITLKVGTPTRSLRATHRLEQLLINRYGQTIESLAPGLAKVPFVALIETDMTPEELLEEINSLLRHGVAE